MDNMAEWITEGWEVTREYGGKPRTVKKEYEGIGRFTVWQMWDKKKKKPYWKWGVGIEHEPWRKAEPRFKSRRNAIESTWIWIQWYLEGGRDLDVLTAPKYMHNIAVLKELQPCSCCHCEVTECGRTWAKDGDYCMASQKFPWGDLCKECEKKMGPCKHVSWDDEDDKELLECPYECDDFLLFVEEFRIDSIYTKQFQNAHE